MAVQIKEILQKYIDLRDRKAEMAKRHSEEMAPLNEAQGNIENYLMHIMNQLGVDQLKESEVGTAFKARTTSCQMQDAVEFKKFAFSPAVEAIANYLEIDLNANQHGTILTIILQLARWDLVDFRAGKKGIQEYIENEKQPVPGVAINTIATISVRRA